MEFGKAIKHNSMQKNKNKLEFPELTFGPAYPHAGTDIFTRVRAALTDFVGFQPSYPRLAEMIGFGGSKTHYWFNVFRHPHVIAFLCLLERLPDRKRAEILSSLCRELPTLDHVRMIVDPVAMSNLEDLLDSPSGLVVVRGGTDFERVFVATAIGAAFQNGNPKRAVAGLDVFPPKKWVPLEGVFYAKQALSPAKRREVLCGAWPSIQASRAQLFVFNGIWAVAAELQQEILNLANKNLVVITCDSDSDAKKIATLLLPPTHVVAIQCTGDKAQLIRIRVETV